MLKKAFCVTAGRHPCLSFDVVSMRPFSAAAALDNVYSVRGAANQATPCNRDYGRMSNASLS